MKQLSHTSAIIIWKANWWVKSFQIKLFVQHNSTSFFFLFLFFFLLYFLFSFFLLRKILTYRSLAMNDVIYALSISLAAEIKISEDKSTLLISTTQKCMPKSKLFQQFSYYTVNYDAHCLFIWYISIRNCRNRSKMVNLVNRSLDRGRKDPF